MAAEVAIRLLDELKRGRKYTVPYRVVVNKVIDWKLNEHYAPAKAKQVELGDHDAQAEDPYVEFEADYDLAVLLEELPPREYDVASSGSSKDSSHRKSLIDSALTGTPLTKLGTVPRRSCWRSSMSTESVDRLFEEFVSAYGQGGTRTFATISIARVRSEQSLAA